LRGRDQRQDEADHLLADVAEETAAAAVLRILQLHQQPSGSVKYSSGVPSGAPPRFSIRIEM
jgi:hypothetical protein